MTLDEVAARYRLHPTSIYRMLKRREIPAFKIGSDWRFSAEALKQWERELRAKQTG